MIREASPHQAWCRPNAEPSAVFSVSEASRVEKAERALPNQNSFSHTNTRKHGRTSSPPVLHSSYTLALSIPLLLNTPRNSLSLFLVHLTFRRYISSSPAGDFISRIA
jgi:hypothetical protein